MRKKIKLVEIARSFSYKMSLPHYENVDFFCSQKAEVPEKKAEKTSEKLYEFCRQEVLKSVCAYKLENIPIKPTTPTKITYQDIKIAQADAPKAQSQQNEADEIPPEAEEANEKIDAMLTPPEAELPVIEE